MHAARKERHELIATLASLPRFADAPPEELDALAAAGRVVSLPAGWTIIAGDTPADSVYLMLRGQTVVQRGGERLAEVGPGSVVGEAGLRDHALRSATVSTTVPVTVLRVGYPEMAALLERHPGLAARVYADYDRRHLAPSEA